MALNFKKRRILPEGSVVELEELRVGAEAYITLPDFNRLKTTQVVAIEQKRKHLRIETQRSVYILKGCWITGEETVIIPGEVKEVSADGSEAVQ